MNSSGAPVNIPTLIDRLRGDLTRAGFTVDALSDLWGTDAAAALHRGHRVPALRALARAGALDAANPTALRGTASLRILATLFVLGLPVAPDDFADALPRLGLAGVQELGLAARTTDNRWRALVDLRPYSFSGSTSTNGAASGGELGAVRGWWIASDLGELSTGAALRVDHVLGVGGASTTLSGLMMHSAVGSALDLGTGCGIQALHAAQNAGRVVATDISQRALDFAAFNATLNDVTNIEFRLGSLFEPVEGERFDRIVSNPPFVITPRSKGVPAYEYRDGGMVGDALVATVIAGVEQHLTVGGVAQLLGNWEYRAGTDGLSRVADWLTPGLDAWVIEREVQDAALYAETWIRDGGTRPGPDFDRLTSAWLDDFESRGVTAVGFGYLTLRRASGTPALHNFERLDGPVSTGLGVALEASLVAFDEQHALSDEELGRQLLVVANDVTEERHYWPGDEHPTVMDLRQGGGLQRTVPLGTGLAALVGACDGELSVRAIVAALAELLEVQQAELLAELLPDIRHLLFAGFLRLS